MSKKLFHEKIKFLFIGQGQVDTWHHLRGLPEASSSRNLEFNNKMVISQELKQFRMIMWNKKCNNSNLHLLGAFRMTVWNFHMIMWNRLANSHLAYNIIPPFGPFFIVMRNGNIWFLSFLLSFLSFPSLDSTSTTSESWSKPIALLLSLCIWIIINIICSLQFDSSLLSPIYQNHTLKWLQNFIKLVSNSCKGNNILIKCFRHSYYSKDAKPMRIII